jgi:DNA-binding MarR family transcriptional regulator
LAQLDAIVAMVQAVAALERDMVELLKGEDLSLAQYNVLRVLRGAGQPGLACGEVAGRLIRHDPDVTRLNDRLAKRGLIERARSEEDRRVVLTRITAKGLEVLAALDGPMDALHEKQLGHMSPAELKTLTTLAEASWAPLREA